MLADHEDHVAADRLAEVAFSKESLREGTEVGDLLVVIVRKLLDGQETLVGVEGEVARVGVGNVVRAVAVADDEELHEAKQRSGIEVMEMVNDQIRLKS